MRTSTARCRNYVGGEWVDSATGRRFASLNPARKSEMVALCQRSDHRDVGAAVDAAEDSLAKWSATPAPKRGEILFRAASLLEQKKEELAVAVTREMGKPLFEASGDVQEAVDIFRYMAGEGRRLLGNTAPSELPGKSCLTVRRPVGVVGLITPWNFPMAIPAWKLAPALVCGNTVVLKPASDTPLCAVRLVELLEKAGLPPGVVNLVTGAGDEVGTPLVRHPKLRGLSFTGSRQTGETILREAGIKRIGLELGGKNPVIIMDDARLDLALDGCLWAGFGTSGQRCTAASRIILHRAIAEKFAKAFVARAKSLRIGDGLDPRVEMGPVINGGQLEKINSYVKLGIKQGAKLLTGGRILTLGRFGKGWFHEPTVLGGVTPDMVVAREEIFGPVVCLMEAKNLDEAIGIANSTDYGLSSSIYTSDISNAFRAIDGLEAGITYVNAPTIGAEVHLPFGGVKKTGGTREAGITGIDEFSELKTVYFDYSEKLQRAQID